MGGRKSEVKSLVYVVLSLSVFTRCYNYSKTVLQVIVVPPGEYPINLFTQIRNPLIIYRVTRIRENIN
jgi:hypothetical protein